MNWIQLLALCWLPLLLVTLFFFSGTESVCSAGSLQQAAAVLSGSFERGHPNPAGDWHKYTSFTVFT